MHGLRFIGSGVICATSNRVVGWNEDGDVVGDAQWISLDTVTLRPAVFGWRKATLSFLRDYSTVRLDMSSASAQTFAEAVARQRVAQVVIDRPPENWVGRVVLLAGLFALGVLALLLGAGLLSEGVSSVWLAVGGVALGLAVVSRRRLFRRMTAPFHYE